MTGKTPYPVKVFHMVNLVKAKICETISHVEVLTELLRPSRKRQIVKLQDNRDNSGNREDPSPKKVKSTGLVQTDSAELKNISDLQMRDANNPGINHIFDFCAVSKEYVMPNFGPQDCMQFLLTGNCKYGKTCKFYHKNATRVQVAGITDKLGRFLKTPSSIKGEKPRPNTPNINFS